MDSSQEDLFETLSAYVDGELLPDERARVARLVASDESVARQVAILQQMSAGVASLVPNAFFVPMPVPRKAPRRRIGVLVGLCLAASVALSAIASVWWGLDTRGTAQMSFLQDAEQQLVLLHDSWLESRDEGAVSDSRSQGYAELLASSGLVRVRHQRVPLKDGRDIQHSGYIGSKGCRLSLFRMAAEEQMNDGLLVEIAAGNSLMKAQWVLDSTQFVLLARKMDETRFLTIVNAIREFERDSDRNAAGFVAALEEARKPCLA